MKDRFFYGIMMCAVLLAGCAEDPARYSHRPVLPVLPPDWEKILGGPHWRVEWVDEGGAWQEWEGGPGEEPPAISMPEEWCTAVLAWPFWPEWNLPAGVMRPSGALFPWDAAGSRLELTWPGGVDALLWKEMSRAERVSQAADGRLPWYFDWPRFRELFKSAEIPENVRQDPWLADWKEIGRKTVQSGFDRRRIAPRKLAEITVPGMEGIWTGTSPFAAPLDAAPEGRLLVNAGDTAETWVSAKGVLKCSTSGWVLIPRE